MGEEVDKDFGNEVDVKSTETIKMVSTSPFQPLKWRRVYFKSVPLFLDVYVLNIDEAERQARLDWIEIANCPIVDSIEELGT